MTLPATYMLKFIKPKQVKHYKIQWFQGGHQWTTHKYSQPTTIAAIKDLQQSEAVDRSTINLFVVTHDGMEIHVYGNDE